MTAPENIELMKRWVDAINRNDLSSIAENIAPDFTRHGLSDAYPGEAGKKDLADLIKALRSGLPDMQVMIEDIFATDDRVAMRFTTAGTHRGNS